MHPEWRAASAGDVLQQATVVASLDEAIADCQLVIGTSARGRRIPWPVQDPRHCAQRAFGSASKGEKGAIVFGREETGVCGSMRTQRATHRASGKLFEISCNIRHFACFAPSREISRLGTDRSGSK